MKLLDVLNNKDKSTTISYELSGGEVDLIKKTLGVKRITKKRLESFVKNSLIALVNVIGKELKTSKS